MRIGCLATTINPDSRSVILASGESLSADVIIAADGVAGIGRRTVAGRDLNVGPATHIFYT